MARSVNIPVALEIAAAGVEKARAQVNKLSFSVGETLRAFHDVTAVVRNLAAFATGMGRTFTAAIRSMIAGAVEFRAENDATVRELQEFSRLLEVVRARAGDALLPVIQALARTLRPMIEQVTRWLEANQRLIAARLVEWIATTAELLAGPLVRSIQGVVGMTTALRAAWALTVAGINEAIASLLANFGLIGKVLAANPMTAGLGAAMQAADALAPSIRGLGEEFARSGATATAELDGLVGRLVENDEAATRTIATVRELVARFREMGAMAVAAATTGGTATREELAAGLLKAKAAQEALAKAQREAWAIERTMFEIRRSMQDAEDARMKKRILARRAEIDGLVNDYAPAIQSVGAAWSETFAHAAAGAQKFEQALAGAAKQSLIIVLGLIRDKLLAYSIEAFGAAFSANVGDAPAPWGPAIAAAVGAGAATTVAALATQLPTAQHGMIVGGGVRGRDSVPVLVEPGEMIVPLPQAGRDAAGGARAGRGGVTVVFNSSVPQHRGDLDRAVRDDLLPSLMRLGIVGA